MFSNVEKKSTTMGASSSPERRKEERRRKKVEIKYSNLYIRIEDEERKRTGLESRPEVAGGATVISDRGERVRRWRWEARRMEQ